jgi:chromosome segregation ATPase
MKSTCAASGAAFLALLSAPTAAETLSAGHKQPVQDVVALIAELERKLEADGAAEQQSYDKYACWCEDTTARKAADISSAKQQITDLQTLITKLKGEIAVHGSEIEDLNNAVAKNIASQKEATDLRSSAHSEYMDTKTESEQCIGALESAVTVLNGAGTGKKERLLDDYAGDTSP